MLVLTDIHVVQFLGTKPEPVDFEAQNIEAVRGEAREKKPEDLLDFGEVYNYAGQHLQYFDMQMDFAKTRYLADYGKMHYTYSKDLLSGAFVLVDPEKEAKRAKKENKARWLTAEGFQWPKARTPKEINSLPEKLPSASYPVIETEFVENEWNAVQDNRLPKAELTEGRGDFNIRYNTHTRPFDTRPEFLKSVFAAGLHVCMLCRRTERQTDIDRRCNRYRLRMRISAYTESKHRILRTGNKK